MRINVVTNVKASALLMQGSIAEVLNSVCENHELILCDQIISESMEVARRRLPQKVEVLEDFFVKMRYEIVPAPETDKIQIKDVNDQPILNAAITQNIDILITGDRHFLELDPDVLPIITLSEFKE